MPLPLALAALSLALALGGCSGGAASGGAPAGDVASGAAPAPEAVTVRVSEAGEASPRAVRLAVGDTLRLLVEERPGTGYGWRLPDPLPAPLAAVSEGEDASGEGGPGGLGVRAVTLRAVARGRARLAMAYVRPWGAGSAASRAEVAVTVE